MNNLIHIMRRVNSPDDIKMGSHYVLILFKQKKVYHEADQRSKDHPGHGYGAYTESIPFCEYYYAEDEDRLKRGIECLLGEDPRRKDFVAMKTEYVMQHSIAVQVHIAPDRLDG